MRPPYGDQEFGKKLAGPTGPACTGASMAALQADLERAKRLGDDLLRVVGMQDPDKTKPARDAWEMFWARKGQT